ncbi:MAG: hypothetical protein J0I19_16120 [Alphaproteobacteria bacterium]|nr:hypothetical protein [Alphaproteobacteria bacterium]
MGKIAGILMVLAVVVAAVLWAGAHRSHANDGPSPAQTRDIDALVERCAHVPRDQMDACTIRNYRKLHPDTP